MKKFFRKLFWFVAVVIGLNVLYLILLLFCSPSFNKAYEVSRFENKKFDAIILGNSMALDAVDASYLSRNGISTYNLSVAGNHVSTSLLLLEDYLAKNQKPRYVVVGLSSAIGKSYLNPVPFANPEVDFFYHPSLWHNIINPPLLNFQWLAVDLLKIMISKDHRNASMELGQWKTKKIIPDQSALAKSNNPIISYDDPYLKKILEICDQNKIELILTELPGSRANRNNLPFKSAYTLSNGKDITIYNLNNDKVSEALIDPGKDWLAADHLNQFGGEKITAYLLKHVFQKQ